jgi:hypothetical protein
MQYARLALLFTVNITRNRMQNPIIKKNMIFILLLTKQLWSKETKIRKAMTENDDYFNNHNNNNNNEK